MQIDDKLTIDLWGDYLSEDGTLDLSSFDIETFKTFKFARNNCIKRGIWPQGIDTIPEEMFSECSSLEEVAIPNTVNKVGEKAFYGCNRLRNVTFERRQTGNLFIGDDCFTYCYALEKVTIPEKASLDRKVFEDSSLEKIIIETEDESVNFEYRHFGDLPAYTDSYEEDLEGTLKIYVKNEAMKEKIKNDFEEHVKPENIIVGLPNEDE